MKLLQIKNIEKKDVPLYYRNEYQANSEFVLMGDNVVIIPIFFAIEMAPTGEKLIDIKIRETIDYPTIPIIRMLKDKVSSMEKEGLLR